MVCCRPARLGEVEAVLALSSRQPQLLLHNLLAGVVRQLEIVGAGHHAGQVVVRVHLHQQVTTDCIALFYCMESWEVFVQSAFTRFRLVQTRINNHGNSPLARRTFSSRW